MSTIREIARELNLSHTTVSRVLNTRNEQTISPATRERVWVAAKSMGYRPHTAARALATGRTQMVALLMHYLYSAFHAEVVHAVEQTVRRSGYQVIVATVDWYQNGGEIELDQIPGQVDGYLAFETASHVSELMAAENARQRNSRPVVAMGGHNIAVETDCAGFDLAAGADMAMTHLLETGRRRIAYVANSRNDPRYERYRDVMRRAGIPEEFILVPSQRRADVREAIDRYFARISETGSRPPEALFCLNDEVAVGAYRALRDRGIRIGADVALVGFDGIEDGAYLDTPITTVALPIRDMCSLAWEMLQRRLSDPDAPPSRTMLLPSLVVRESTVEPSS
jgi:LacI family transcriptional regulator